MSLLPVAGVAQRGRGRSAGPSEEEGREGEARQETREEDGEEGRGGFNQPADDVTDDVANTSDPLVEVCFRPQRGGEASSS